MAGHFESVFRRAHLAESTTAYSYLRRGFLGAGLAAILQRMQTSPRQQGTDGRWAWTPPASGPDAPQPTLRWPLLVLGPSSAICSLIGLALSTRLGEASVPVPVVGIQATAVILTAAAQAAALQMGRRRPIRAFLITTGASCILLLTTQNRAVAVTLCYFVAIMFVAMYGKGPRAVAAVAAGIAADFGTQCVLLLRSGTIAASANGTSILATSLLNVIISYIVCLGMGYLVALHRERAAQVRLHVEQSERERAAAAREAVAAERRRMARELHDVTAHHLSTIVMHARLAQLHAADPDERQAAVSSILDQALRSLTSLRQIVTILRLSNETEEPSQQGIEDIPALLRAVEQGLGEVSYSVDGDLSGLPDAVQFASYRIVQESLSNVVRHATGTDVSVTVRRLEGEIVIRVKNSASLARFRQDGASGFGLTGMRERVALLSGRLQTGPTSDGGWAVEASLALPAKAS